MLSGIGRKHVHVEDKPLYVWRKAVCVEMNRVPPRTNKQAGTVFDTSIAFHFPCDVMEQKGNIFEVLLIQRITNTNSFNYC